MKSIQSRPGTHRRRQLCLPVAGVVVLGALAACGGGGGTEAEQPKANPIAAGKVPAYYPAGYSDLVSQAEHEGGTLTIYSNTSEENWAPVFRDFKKKYGFVTKISANDLDSDEVFQKVLSEQATGSSPVDLVVSNAASAWATFAARPKMLASYQSPELSKLPDYAKLLPDVYAMAMDPQLLAYNTSLMDKPKGLHDLAEKVAADPGKFNNKITVRDPESSFGFTVTHAYTKALPTAWDDFKKLLPKTRPETSSGTQMEKILSGEYMAGFLISGGPAYPVVGDSDGLVDVVYPEEGTVVLPRGIGLAADAPHPATAKLFIDFLLSAEGQRAVAEGGLSSYRAGVSGPGLHTYQELVDKVGKDKVIQVPYTEVSKNESDAWLKRFDDLVGK
ncbi:ABC transporter substrate-binding protein [Streptomyces sp. NPDC057486]|uniref:ABC transporter substrate-binding protein n=1 Tax=Streptomyces sp. NPDC057486 TaxID=3346145 RepID=UPI0036C7D133